MDVGVPSQPQRYLKPHARTLQEERRENPKFRLALKWASPQGVADYFYLPKNLGLVPLSVLQGLYHCWTYGDLSCILGRLCWRHR